MGLLGTRIQLRLQSFDKIERFLLSLHYSSDSFILMILGVKWEILPSSESRKEASHLGPNSWKMQPQRSIYEQQRFNESLHFIFTKPRKSHRNSLAITSPRCSLNLVVKGLVFRVYDLGFRV